MTYYDFFFFIAPNTYNIYLHTLETRVQLSMRLPYKKQRNSYFEKREISGDFH